MSLGSMRLLVHWYLESLGVDSIPLHSIAALLCIRYGMCFLIQLRLCNLGWLHWGCARTLWVPPRQGSNDIGLLTVWPSDVIVHPAFYGVEYALPPLVALESSRGLSFGWLLHGIFFLGCCKGDGFMAHGSDGLHGWCLAAGSCRALMPFVSCWVGTPLVCSWGLWVGLLPLLWPHPGG